MPQKKRNPKRKSKRKRRRVKRKATHSQSMRNAINITIQHPKRASYPQMRNASEKKMQPSGVAYSVPPMMPSISLNTGGNMPNHIYSQLRDIGKRLEKMEIPKIPHPLVDEARHEEVELRAVDGPPPEAVVPREDVGGIPEELVYRSGRIRTIASIMRNNTLGELFRIAQYAGVSLHGDKRELANRLRVHYGGSET